MSVLAALTIVLTVASAAHLLVTFGLVRRLRAHTDLLRQLAGSNDRLLPPGTALPAFAGRTTDGSTVTEASLQHPAAVALLAVNCPHCRTNLPDFVAYVQGAGYPREQVLAVVATDERTDPAAHKEMLDALAPVATLVSESGTQGTVAAAFGTQAFPTFYLTRPDATLAVGSHAVRGLPDTTAYRSAPADR
ncbi:redoxin domain-containing protein [Streptomyces syringium]|uniref:redoxin domain-containing protein n=1 Tax=Streptomyces syringium TaxID=76729 RepID=UPI003649E653